jgi:hypothetical protein
MMHILNGKKRLLLYECYYHYYNRYYARLSFLVSGEVRQPRNDGQLQISLLGKEGENGKKGQ